MVVVSTTTSIAMSTNSTHHNGSPANSDLSYKIKVNVDTLQQYLMMKMAIVEKIKATQLFPYLIEMEYLVGNINGIKVSDDPIEKLGPYLRIQNGINEKMKVNFTREELLEWEVFRLNILLPTEFHTYNDFEAFIILRIQNDTLSFLVFGIINDNIIEAERTILLLDKDDRILEVKRKLGYKV